MRRKLPCNLSVGLNSGHPLFIGEGRTGAESPEADQHKKNDIKSFFFFFFRRGLE